MKISKDVAKKIKVIRQMLEKNGLLNDADEMNLQMLAEEFQVYNMCLQEIEEKGITMLDRVGGLKINPAASMRNRSANTILQILKEFGISTKSRKLLLMKDIDTEHEETPLSQYIKSIK